MRALALAVALLPALWLAVRVVHGGLGANPIEELTHATGDAALRMLVLTLAVTPARRWIGWAWLAPERRTFGLAAYAYACLHFATYLVLDLELDFAHLGEDVLERPYITAGFTAFVLLTPLALTSTRAAMRRLGRRWPRLHRLVYPAAGAALLHYLWLVKADLRDPLVYSAIVAGLLWLRLRRPTAHAR